MLPTAQNPVVIINDCALSALIDELNALRAENDAMLGLLQTCQRVFSKQGHSMAEELEIALATLKPCVPSWPPAPRG